MTRYLFFTLAAPLASFGAVAVGERRSSWDRPSKSQIIGLVAASLGVERTDETRQRVLTEGLGFAVRVDEPGRLASDYHTAQSPKEAAMKRRVKTLGPIRTRADELTCDDLKTILSRREFIVGSLHTIALWRIGETAPTFDKIKTALKAPVFTLYVGRKAHPLMLPMAPQSIERETIEEAFAAFDAEEGMAIRDLKTGIGLKARQDRPIFADISAIPADQRGARVVRLEERRDRPESRAKWRFGLRSEAVLRDASKGEEKL